MLLRTIALADLELVPASQVLREEELKITRSHMFVRATTVDTVQAAVSQ